jgi:inhibitor of cysteine peptidase
VSTQPCGRSKFKVVENVPDVTFQAKDNGKTVSVPVGQHFRVVLKENPTTGYKWDVPEFDEQCLSLESNDYTLADGGGVGGGGVRQFEFAVRSACKTTLRLVNKRSWEKNVMPAAGFEITVVGTQ